uniref:Uncharacterized protein n=1 Tax=Oryzias latipes TaxID=8090 RepID=A0A3P9LRN1_ORYLA
MLESPKRFNQTGSSKELELSKVINRWNSNRLDLFHISQPDEVSPQPPAANPGFRPDGHVQTSDLTLSE